MYMTLDKTKVYMIDIYCGYNIIIIFYFLISYVVLYLDLRDIGENNINNCTSCINNLFLDNETN